MFEQYEKEMEEFKHQQGCSVKFNGEPCGKEGFCIVNGEWVCVECWERIKTRLDA